MQKIFLEWVWEHRRKCNDMLMISSTYISCCIYTRAEYLILDTVKVQCPPFSVVEVDRAGRERGVGIFRVGSRHIFVQFEKRNKKI